MKGLKKFLIVLYMYRFFVDFVLLYPVYMLLFESKGLSLFHISLLMMIWSVPVLLLEIPSGMLSDCWNRKYIIVIGTACKLLCFVLWLFAGDFWLFALGFVFWGTGEAFCSGSVQALLYDVLKKYEEEEQYEKYAGRAGFYGGIGIAASMLLGGWAASVGYDAAAWLSVASVAAAAVITLFLEEAEASQAESLTWAQYLRALREGLAPGRGNPRIIMLLMFCSLVVIVPGILEEYDQLYVSRVGLSLGMVGVWGGMRTGAEALGSRFAFVLKRWFGTIRRLCVLVIIGGVMLFVPVYAYSMYLLPVYGLFYALIAGVYVLSESMLQREVPSAQRAAFLSVNNLLMNVFGLILYLGFAGASTLGGLRAGFLGMAVYMVMVAAVFMVIGRKDKGTRA